jgi:hypothetical protein
MLCCFCALTGNLVQHQKCAAAVQHNARTLSDPQTQGATITMDGGVHGGVADTARGVPVVTLPVLTQAVNRQSLGGEKAPD